MSELRRNGGPDDGDEPADHVAKPDDPARRPNMEIRSADQNPDRPVDRRKVTAAQREFIRAEKQAADSGAPREPTTTYAIDWETGEPADGRYTPPAGDKDHAERDDSPDDLDRASAGNTPAERHSPYAEPPPDLNRDNSGLDAYKPEVPEAVDPADRFSELTVRKRRGDRIAGELAEKADDVVEHVGDVFKTFEDLTGSRPTGHPETQCKATPPPWAQPVATSATHSGVDIVMAIAAGGLAAAEAGRRMRDRVHDWREHRAGNG